MGRAANAPHPTRHRVTISAEFLGLPARAPAAGREASVAERVRVALDRDLRAVVAHDPGTRSGADPEDLHQMRVAVRRMRAVLRSARDTLDRDWADDTRAELGWLGRALGPVRDLDVLVAHLRAESQDFADEERAAVERLLDGLCAERRRARERLLAVLAEERYQALLHRLADAATTGVPASGHASDLMAVIRREYRALRDSVRRAHKDPTDQRLHAIRVRGKRLRYTLELAEPALGKRGRRVLRALREMQDVLGEHQDAHVAEERVRALLTPRDGDTPVPPEVAFVAGRLVERERRRRELARARWPDVWAEVEHRAHDL
ncbi:CHAD domain-containing protein [Streptoalloteichus tenebrarius]|uniref:CHAD domain-containing protein n=1 Tax=Streptoalloteichus tenebrarius (strain ATCC 17920 / DSM 40477 / JCM 4838 / CBS 697.72 / NBRC 16177 / NCIMB 11028 / NRRL B-12390 / A12253. 1 / ISP 5477) TaxID=1933 RepID=A0ABT1I375_STRSD|nr:CHAD domain-containing protein [Streptoalloteichus tenebrarius]MCP2262217.1 CHAD domain-containing protein [Streptoalloteichus tenebrarius]BFF01081.1 CHAD domain-containing protein [Streptoalloteichus tenebrarius]